MCISQFSSFQAQELLLKIPYNEISAGKEAYNSRENIIFRQWLIYKSEASTWKKWF